MCSQKHILQQTFNFSQVISLFNFYNLSIYDLIFSHFSHFQKIWIWLIKLKYKKLIVSYINILTY